MNEIGPTFVAVIGGVLCLAMIAVLVSQNAQTSTVLQGGGTALASVIQAAVAPVSSTTSTSFGTNSQNAGGVTV